MAESKTQRLRFANEEIVSNGNLHVVEQVFTPDYVLHTGGKQARGPAFVRRFIGQLKKAIPDVRVVAVEVLALAGNTVTWQRTLRGTHRAAMKGIPPSGRRVEWRDMMVTRFDGAKIAEEWAVSDLAGQLMLKLPRA